MTKIEITLTEEQFAVFSNEDEIIGMVTNYANHQLESAYDEEFKKLSLSDKKKKVTLPKKEKEVIAEE